MGHKYGIGDIVYSTIWNEKVRIKEIKDNLFYVVDSLKSQSWMLTHELNLKVCEDEIDKMVQEHQEICDDILAIQNIDISEFEFTDEYEAMYYESERRYEEEYSTGEYCHEQSFKWGFQEGFDYAMKTLKKE